MDNGREEEVRRRAYEIWQAEGCSGNPEDHWLRAERESNELSRESGEAASQERPAEIGPPQKAAEEKMATETGKARSKRS